MSKKVYTSDGTAELVKELKKLDFPTFGNPTIPIFKLLEGRPKSGFCTSAAFFGAISFHPTPEHFAPLTPPPLSTSVQ
jgi:hypothetical protein